MLDANRTNGAGRSDGAGRATGRGAGTGSTGRADAATTAESLGSGRTTGEWLAGSATTAERLGGDQAASVGSARRAAAEPIMPSDAEIRRLTGNPDVSAYDPAIAARAIREGVTYNRAVENANGADVGPAERAVAVRELPWERAPVNARVDELVAEEGLSVDAAIVLAMTEREPAVRFSGPFGDDLNALAEPAIDAEWRDEFAAVLTRSADEIETWAASQTTDAVTFVAGDNDIVVTRRDDGMIVVTSTLNGVARGAPQVIDPSATDRIVINAGAGDDTITVDASVTEDLTLVGGNGRDFIYGGGGNDIIVGGAGDDLVRAGAGSDIVLGSAGDDNLEGNGGGDILYGNDGDDFLSGDRGADLLLGGEGDDAGYGGDGTGIVRGQAGNDYLDGGEQDDLVEGGTGDDVVSGGKGDDELAGDAGTDTQIGASGNDTYRAGSLDTLILEGSEDTVALRARAAEVRVIEHDARAGSEAVSIDPASRADFGDRVEADLETLRSLDSGQAMLDTLDRAARDSRVEVRFPVLGNVVLNDGNRVRITELDGADHIDFLRNPGLNPSTENGFAAPSSNDWRRAPGDAPAPGADVTVRYNPSVNLPLNTGASTPPIVILFHELAHGYNMTTGTGLEGTYAGTDDRNVGINNTERQAVGLPVDHDGDPSTPERTVAGHPDELTENGLRTELGLTLRPFY